MLIQNNTANEQANILAGYLRNDRLHQNKWVDGTNLRKLLIGLAEGFVDFNNNLNIFIAEGDIAKATSLLIEWEKTFGIPDDCLTNNGTIEERRINLLIKLAGLQGTLIEQFEYVINLLGYSGIQIKTGVAGTTYPLQYPFYYLSVDEAPFTMFVILPAELTPTTYPLPYPIPYNSIIPKLQCIFDKLKPANVKIIYQFLIPFVDTTVYFSAEDGSILTLENGSFIAVENA